MRVRSDLIISFSSREISPSRPPLAGWGVWTLVSVSLSVWFVFSVLGLLGVVFLLCCGVWCLLYLQKKGGCVFVVFVFGVGGVGFVEVLSLSLCLRLKGLCLNSLLLSSPLSYPCFCLRAYFLRMCCWLFLWIIVARLRNA